MTVDFFCEKCESSPLILDVEMSNKNSARCICKECGYIKYISSESFNEDYFLLIEQEHGDV